MFQFRERGERKHNDITTCQEYRIIIELANALFPIAVIFMTATNKHSQLWNKFICPTACTTNPNGTMLVYLENYNQLFPFILIFYYFSPSITDMAISDWWCMQLGTQSETEEFLSATINNKNLQKKFIVTTNEHHHQC